MAVLERLFSNAPLFAAQTALDGLALRHQVLADNIANVNTPGYKRQEVEFEDQLKRALNDPEGTGTTCSDTLDVPAGCPLPRIKPRIITENNTSERPDGNNVDLEYEMAQMAANTIKFEALTEYVTDYFTDLKSVINGTPKG
ncbi:MAG: flagellar basal body rod protein FlgB [Armatimonadetes bacterium]|nr:flagellar basal body rod protein FlgB [Armatimonadota bacterium]